MVKVGIAFAMLVTSGAAIAAPASLTHVNVAKGEMLLEVSANGASSAKITKVSTTCDIKAAAQGKGQAMSLLEQRQAALSKALQNAGLNSARLDFSAAVSFSGETFSAAAADAAVAAVMVNGDTSRSDAARVEPIIDESMPFVEYSRRIGITTNLAAQMQEVRGLIKEYGCEEDYRALRNTLIELENPGAAKAAAVKMAITASKQQAENYAAALGLKVVRILRISEVGAIREFFGAESDAFIREMRNDRDRQNLVADELPVTATISVDFVLGPK